MEQFYSDCHIKQETVVVVVVVVGVKTNVWRGKMHAATCPFNCISTLQHMNLLVIIPVHFSKMHSFHSSIQKPPPTSAVSQRLNKTITVSVHSDCA